MDGPPPPPYSVAPEPILARSAFETHLTPSSTGDPLMDSPREPVYAITLAGIAKAATVSNS